MFGVGVIQPGVWVPELCGEGPDNLMPNSDQDSSRVEDLPASIGPQWVLQYDTGDSLRYELLLRGMAVQT